MSSKIEVKGVKMSVVNRGIVLVLAVAGCVAASAQDAEQQVPEQHAAAPTLVGADGMRDHAREMQAVEKEIDKGLARVRHKNVMRDEQKLDAEMRGGVDDSQPVLIGIYAGRSRSMAEFAVGNTARRVEIGGYVTHNTKLVRLGSNEAVLARDGRESRVFLSAQRPATSGPGMPPMSGGSRPVVIPAQ